MNDASNQNQSPVPVPDNNEARNFTWVTYAMYALGLVTGLFCLVGVIMAYAKRGEFANTIYADHMQYLIRTFWVGLLGMVAGFLLMIILIGWLVIVATGVWFVYRIVMGAIRLNDGQSVSTTSWL